MSFIFSQPAPGILPANSVDFSEVETIAGNRLLGNNLGVESTIQELQVSDVATMLNLAQYAVGAASSTPTSIPVFSDSNGKILVDNSGWRITGSALIPFADGAGDIGGSAIARPGEVWVKTRINLNSLAASQILASDGSKNVVSLDTATYPSLTELSYVKGVSSAIQTQLNGKASTQLNNLGTTAINADLLFNPDNTYNIGIDGDSRPSGIHAANHITAPLVRARDNDGLSQRHLIVRAGNSSTGNGDGGNLTIAAGTPNGTGVAGVISLQTDGVERLSIETDGSIKTPNYILSPFSNSQTHSVSGSLSIDWATAPIQIITLNADITSLTFSNVVEGGAYLIKVVQGSGAPYTITWPTIKWLGGTPTLSTNSGDIDVISLTYVGGEYLAVASLGFV